jgi:hypothetical protein
MMHPCPSCQACQLTMQARVQLTRRLTITQYESQPPAFDYEIHEEHDNDLDITQIECDECGHTFQFDLDAYQRAWPDGAPLGSGESL